MFDSQKQHSKGNTCNHNVVGYCFHIRVLVNRHSKGLGLGKHWFLHLGQALWCDHLKSSSRRDWSDDILILTFGTSTLMGPHELLISSGLIRRHIDFDIWDKHSDGTTWTPHLVGTDPTTYWFWHLGQALWWDHMNSSSRRDWSDDILILTFGTSTLMGPHELLISSGLIRRHVDFYIWEKHSNGTKWNPHLVGIGPTIYWFFYLVGPMTVAS